MVCKFLLAPTARKKTTFIVFWLDLNLECPRNASRMKFHASELSHYGKAPRVHRSSAISETITPTLQVSRQKYQRAEVVSSWSGYSFFFGFSDSTGDTRSSQISRQYG